MILAEKIVKLRKQNGWSQEDLAVRLNISRQSVSKWESTASVPDLDKIIKLSELFGVSTDYLLKDEMEEDPGMAGSGIDRSIGASGADAEQASDMGLGAERAGANTGAREEAVCGEAAREESKRWISMEEANRFLDVTERSAKKIAGGVAACILSPVMVILLAGMAEQNIISMSEDTAGILGVIILLVMVAAAVGGFIMTGMQLNVYEYMETEPLDLEYGIAGIAERKKEAFSMTHKKCITIGVMLCILSVIPIFIAAAFHTADIVYIFCICLLLVMVALAVYLFIWAGMIFGSCQKLLEEGEYTREKKLENKRNSALASVYWCAAVAIYLGSSFLTGRWDITWVIWPCAGVLYGAVCGIAAMIRRKS